MTPNEMMVAVAVRRKSLDTFLALVLRLQRIVFGYVLVDAVPWQTTGLFTLVLAFLSVFVDMVTYVVIYMEMYEVHVVLQLVRLSARVATSLVRTPKFFVDPLILGR